jgi:2-octaprenyl-6-methoxyphenol hydroxylase
MMTKSQPDQRYDVVVSGASFAGLALARALTQALGDGLRIAVVDRAVREPGERPDARAFALSAASKHMLDVLGIWESLASEAQPVSEIDITDSSLDAGIRPIVLSYDNRLADHQAGAADATEPATFIVPASALERSLLQSVTAIPSITLIAPAEVTGIAWSDAGITVSLRDREPLVASLLVGAEGRRSATREAAGIETLGWKYDQTAIVTTIAHAKPHNGHAIQHFLPGGPFAILPLTGDRSCITWSENAAEAQRILALDDAGFLAEIEQRVGGRLGSLTIAGPRQSWPLEMHLAKSYVAPRFAVIGDAAHGVHPIAGQGVNLAFRDVAALTEVLAESRRIGLDLGDWDTLKRYERWRRFDSAVSAATFDALNRLFSNDNAVLRAARDFGLGVVDRTPLLKKLFVTEASGTLGTLPRLLKGEAI